MQQWFILHPYLFGLFPVLFLYVQNAHHMMFTEVLAPAVVIVVAISLLNTMLILVTKDKLRAGIISSLLVVSFFSWQVLQEISQYLNDVQLMGSYQMWTWVTLLAMTSIVLWIVRKVSTSRSLDKVASIVTMVASVLILMQVARAGWAWANRPSFEEHQTSWSIQAVPEVRFPNIYYIIVDGYPRADLLQEIFDYDNSAFLDQLRGRGFFIADSSHSNYSQTLLSMTSSLNMNMLASLATLDPDSKDRSGVMRLMQDNQVLKLLRQIGYKIVAFNPGYNATQISGVDYSFGLWYDFSEFSSILLSLTPLPTLVSRTGFQNTQARERIIYTLDRLPELDGVEEPYFAMAHVICPHPPFLWDKDGNEYNRVRSFQRGDGNHYYEEGGTYDGYISGYANQLNVLNPMLITAIDRILERNKGNPPVIIIQADHGSGSMLDHNSLEHTYVRERFAILNAYYLPGVDSHNLYPTISPVNSFRVVLSSYFNTTIPLLEDRSIYSQWERPFDFIDVTDSLQIIRSPESFGHLTGQ